MKKLWNLFKERAKNKKWLIAFFTAIICFIAHILSYFGIIIPTDTIITEMTFIITAIFGLLAMWTNPLSPGFGDPDPPEVEEKEPNVDDCIL